MKKVFILFLILCFSYHNMIQANSDKINDEKDIQNLSTLISQSLDHENLLTYKHILKSVSSDGQIVTFEDQMTFTINWWYRSVSKKWRAGDHIYINFNLTHKQIELKHATLQSIAWATIKYFPFPFQTIKAIPNGPDNPDAYSKLTLDSGYIFRSMQEKALGSWTVKDRVLIFSNSDQTYQLWNITNHTITSFYLIGNLQQEIRKPIEIKDILGIENRLNSRVLQQSQAINTVVTSLINYTAGLNEREKPIGVFLFLGPTGVGKTELAKALTYEIYEDPSKIIRFDMSHFTEYHSLSRLIGSQPGYVNHEEGGQLTNPLHENPQKIVLLDEIEKAHPQVIKIFLPVFDEGFISDTKNNFISCNETIFIMTSNLCAQEIAQFYNQGYSEEEILKLIEPILIRALSPEFYNRVEPIIFKSLKPETMDNLVELMLDKVKERVFIQKKIQIHIEDSLKHFLSEHGYHPLLGARPLKRLIEKRVITPLAYMIIKENIGNESELFVFYDKDTDSILVHKKEILNSDSNISENNP